MARLPIPGSDQGTWGSVLNDFLSVTHKPDGTFKSFVSVKDFGAKGDGVTDDTNAMQNALNAVPFGGTLVIPQAQNYYKISNSLAPTADNVTIIGLNIRTEIHQTASNATPVFDLIDHPGCTVSNLTLINDVDKTTFGGNLRADSRIVLSTGVYTNVSRTHCYNLIIKNFSCGILLHAYSTEKNAFAAIGREDCVFENIEGVGLDFGILAYDSVRMVIRRVICRDAVDSSKGINPMHTLYLTGTRAPSANAPQGYTHKDVIISDIGAQNIKKVGDGAAGDAIAAKCIDGGTISNVWADTCNQLLGGLDNRNLIITNLNGKNIIPLASHILGNTITGSGLSYKVKITNVLIEVASMSDRPVVHFQCDDGELSDLTIYGYRTGSVNSQEVVVHGERNRLKNIKVKNTQSVNVGCAIGIGGGLSADRTIIEDIEVDNIANIVQLSANATNTYISYDPNKFTNISTAGLYNVLYIGKLGSGENHSFTLQRLPCERKYPVGASAFTLYPRPAMETTSTLDITGNGTITINKFNYEPAPGHVQTIRFFNRTGGNIGSVVWNSVYKLASAFVAPINGGIVDYTFYFDGTNYSEITKR